MRSWSVIVRIALGAALLAPPLAAEELVTVTSPDGQIAMRIFLGPPPADDYEFQHLAYQVDFRGKRLLDTSYLGFSFLAQVPLGQKLVLESVTSHTVDEKYTLVAGKTKTVRDHYNEVVAEYFQEGTTGRRMILEVRAYDDGIAFRYVVPPSSPLPRMQIEHELTQFNFAKDGPSYPLELAGFQTPYEDEYREATLSGVHTDALIAMPFLVQEPSVGWVGVTEAAIENYAGAYLNRVHDRTYQVRLSPRLDGSGLEVDVPTPMETPWRVLLIADRPEKLIESNIVTSLNESSKLMDTSWIQPGKAAWDGWNGSTKKDTAGIEHSIDFAASAGLEYMVIDEGWAATGNRKADDLLHTVAAVDLPHILQHANQKKVGVWLWAYWRSVEAQMEQAFAQFERWGVRGVVVDGMDRDDQDEVEFYRKVAETAMAHHLMIDFHGAYKPDGLERTYPNVLTRESVLGLKYDQVGARVTPEHDVMLAFTRMLAGPLDYAPGGFHNATPEEFVAREDHPMTLGTRAHQLALYVVFESPLQIVADAPEVYQGQRDFDFVKQVPTSWDETRALMGKAGEYIAIARRRANDWYLGAITNGTARELDLPLGFLDSGEYTADIYADAPDAATNPTHTAIQSQTVKSPESLRLKLASGGGAAIRFRPTPK